MPFDTTPVPCRPSVILARNAPVGVIFRRGPSKLVELIKWHTDTDTFERGQWFKGRIYEEGSDLSPDGSLLIYFAAKMQLGRQFDKEHFPAWTAISRPPWLTALALWPASGVSFFGGGLFIDDETIWLSPHTIRSGPHKDHRPQGLRIVTEPDRPPARFTRDGWRRITDETPFAGGSLWEKADPCWRRAISTQGSPFPNNTYGSGFYSYECSLVDLINGERVPVKEATWADWDQKGRLVFTRHGKVFAGDFDAEGQMTPRELADFNADTFEPRRAPAWAQEW
jgi:hypothetical protein